MVNIGGKLSFGNKLRGDTLTGVDGAEFSFYPTIGFTSKKLLEFSDGIKSMRKPLELAVREVIRPSIAENFRVGGRPEWAELADSTLKKKTKINPKINVNHGTLARVAAQRNIWDIGPHTAIIRGGALISRVPYALFVQAGHKNRSHSREVAAATKLNVTLNAEELSTLSTPARPYLMIQPEDAEKVKEIFALWLDERIARIW